MERKGMRPPFASFFVTRRRTMNTINNSMVHAAMDGQSLYIKSNSRNTNSEPVKDYSKPITPSGAEVAENIEQTIQETKADTQQLQKMSEIVTGRKLQFSVNKELNDVIVTVVDSKTNQVLKEIPSEDMQKLKLRIRKQLGNVYNRII